MHPHTCFKDLILLASLWIHYCEFYCRCKYASPCTVDTTRIKPFSTYVCTERIFDSPPFKHVQERRNIFEKTVIKVGSRISHLYASFGAFYVQIDHLFEAQRDFKISEEFEIDGIFLLKQRFDHFPTLLKDSLCLE